MCKYCEIPAAFTWEIVNDSEDIGSWELLFNENKFYGNGIREFVNVAKSLSKDERVVIFCKQMKWLVYLLQNHEDLSTCDFKARGGKKGIDFFYLLLCDNVELRNWDNFWNKIDSTDDFIRRIGACREVFNHRKGELRKEPASLEIHYNYTLAKEMWDDMTQ